MEAEAEQQAKKEAAEQAQEDAAAAAEEKMLDKQQDGLDKEAAPSFEEDWNSPSESQKKTANKQ